MTVHDLTRPSGPAAWSRERGWHVPKSLPDHVRRLAMREARRLEPKAADDLAASKCRKTRKRTGR